MTAVLFLMQALTAPAREPMADADRWLTNDATFPEKFANAPLSTEQLATLRAEAIGGRLQVTCAASENFSDFRIMASADAPGHWPARDWRSSVMNLRGANWVAELPVDSLDVPLIYFVTARSSRGSVVSPMRIVEPRALGLEQPTRLFWAFVEGFEQGLESWRVSEPTGTRTDATAKDGQAALAVRVPPRSRSVTVQTTRLRGWFLEEHGVTGIGLWLRTKGGIGTASFTLIANAFTTNQVMSCRPAPAVVSNGWTKVLLPFDTFPKIPLGHVDLFSLELSAEPGTEFLVDNVYLLGRWRDDF